MKTFVLVCATALVAASMASAATQTFYPNPQDMGDLDHYKYYKWGINWSVPAGNEITGATLTLKDIYNWKYETNNSLWIHLLPSASVGLTVYTDNQGMSDAFAGQGILIDRWQDYSNPPTAQTVVYNFATLGILDTFKSYAADGNWGFGLDPDCHFYNKYIRFDVTYGAIPPPPAPVPEPLSMTLSLVGLAGVSALRKAKSRAV